jgi:hypothetical protein
MIESSINSKLEIIYCEKQDGMEIIQENKKIGFLHLIGLEKTVPGRFLNLIKSNENIRFVEK